MGWYYTPGATRADVVAELLNDPGSKVLAHSLRGSVLWAVRECERDGKAERFIACYLLGGGRNEAGYKPLTESMGPCEKSCPLSYFDMVPDPGGYATPWREEVRKFQAAQKQKRARRAALKLGDTIELVPGCKPPSVTITSLAPLRGEYGGCIYRIAPRHLP